MRAQSNVLVREIAYRPLPSQRDFHAAKTRFKCFIGPVGCVAGNTVLDGSANGRSIAELASLGIAPVVETLYGRHQASVPFRKGSAEFYNVELTTGESILVTRDHLFLTASGWKKIGAFSDHELLAKPALSLQDSRLALSHADESRSDGRLPPIEPYRQCSSQGVDQRVFPGGGQHSCHIPVNLQNRYSVYLRGCSFCDEQPRSSLSIGRELVPSPAYAHEHTHQSWRKGALGRESICIRPYLECVHPAKTDCGAPHYVFDGREYCAQSDTFEHIDSWSQCDGQSPIEKLPQQPIDEFQHRESGMLPMILDIQADVPPYYSKDLWGVVASVRESGFGEFFDITVPGAEHYFAHGMVHHNSGKSAALVQECIRCAVRNPGLPGLLAAPTYRLLEDSTKLELLTVLENNSIPHVIQKSSNTIFLKDLNVPILCRSMDEPERLRAMNLAWFGVDELTYCKEAAFLRLLGRLRHPKATQLSGFAACTPNGYDWVYERFFGEKKTANYTGIKAIPRENYHLAEGFYEELESSYDALFFQQEVLGDFVNMKGGKAYHAFARERNVSSDIHYDPSARLAWSLDFNISPMASVIAQIRSKEIGGKRVRTIEVVDEIILENSTIDAACTEFRARTARLIPPNQRLTVSIFGDPAGNQGNRQTAKSDWQTVFDNFVRYPAYRLDLNIGSSHSPVKDRVNATNGALYNAAGEVRLTVHPRCKVLIRDLEQVVWGRDAHGNPLTELNKTDPKLTHACFTPDTKVQTIWGEMEIGKAPEFGFVRTWNGQFVPYQNVGKTRENALIVDVFVDKGGESVVTCSQEHLWLTSRGHWQHAGRLKGHRLATWMSGLSRLPGKTSTGKRSFDTTGPNDTSEVHTEKENSISIESYGSPITDQSLKILSFIIRTETDQTTKSRIWNYLLPLITSGSISTRTQLAERLREHIVWLWHVKRQKPGTEVMLGVHGIKRIMRKCAPVYTRKLASHVFSAEQSLRHSPDQRSARTSAAQNTEEILASITKDANALSAKPTLPSINIKRYSAVAENAGQCLPIESVVSAGQSDVCCLYVPGTGCFALSSGAIVSNSDAAGYLSERVIPLANRVTVSVI